MLNFPKKHEERFYQELLKRVKPNGQWMPIGHLLWRAAQIAGHTGGIQYQDTWVPYNTLYWHAHCLSQKLKQKGVKPRDRVLLFVENSPEFYIGYFAIAQISAVVVPLNVYLKQRELAHIVTDAQPSLIIASKDLAKQLYENGIENLPQVLTEEDMHTDEIMPDDCGPAPEIVLKDTEMSALLYTSGTTGLPKGVMLSAENIMSNIASSIARIGIDQQARVFAVLPLFHSFAQMACVWGSLLMGCIVILVPKVDRRHILKGLEHKPNVCLGVPALYGLFCLLKTADFSQVGYFICGGDALPDKIRAAFALIYGRKLCSGYGLTETSPVLTVDMDDETVPTNNVGRPLIDVHIAIRDEKNNVLGKNKIGVIWAKGPMVMLGYYKEPERTSEVIHDQWFDTGDLGYLDDKNRLVITGRKKDLIISKGLNIYPQEIENVLLMHPTAIRAAVIGTPDDDYGEVPVAFVQIRSKEENIEIKLRQLCARNLASYKLPKKIIVVTRDLPLTGTGKVDKKTLKKEWKDDE